MYGFFYSVLYPIKNYVGSLLNVKTTTFNAQKTTTFGQKKTVTN